MESPPVSPPSQPGRGCTSGFTVYSAASGQYYGTTAGHCGPTGSKVKIGTSYISDVGINTFFPDTGPCADSNGVPCVDSDAARFFIPASNSTGRINTGPGGHRPVRGQLSNAGLQDYPEKSRLCFQGTVSAADNCGPLIVRDQPLFINPPPGGTAPSRYLRHTWCIDAQGPGELPHEAVLQPNGEVNNDRAGPNSDPGDSGGPFYQVDLLRGPV